MRRNRFWLIQIKEDESGATNDTQNVVNADNDSEEDFTHEKVEEIDEFSGSEFASDPETMNDFITNSDEIMENLDEQVLALEADPISKDVIEGLRGVTPLKVQLVCLAFLRLSELCIDLRTILTLLEKEKWKQTQTQLISFSRRWICSESF